MIFMMWIGLIKSILGFKDLHNLNILVLREWGASCFLCILSLTNISRKLSVISRNWRGGQEGAFSCAPLSVNLSAGLLGQDFMTVLYEPLPGPCCTGGTYIRRLDVRSSSKSVNTEERVLARGWTPPGNLKEANIPARDHKKLVKESVNLTQGWNWRSLQIPG